MSLHSSHLTAQPCTTQFEMAGFLRDSRHGYKTQKVCRDSLIFRMMTHPCMLWGSLIDVARCATWKTKLRLLSLTAKRNLAAHGWIFVKDDLLPGEREEQQHLKNAVCIVCGWIQANLATFEHCLVELWGTSVLHRASWTAFRLQFRRRRGLS